MAKFTGMSKELGHQARNKTCVLLVNLGTPQAPTTQAVRTYLAEFLADPRVVEIPRLIWLAILHGIILRVRPAKSAALYKEIWTDQGSPLMDISLKQTAALQKKVDQEGLDVRVELAMRYGEPAIGKTMAKLQQEGVDKFVVLPLYPQYSATTTGSVFDAIAAEMGKWRFMPSLHFIHTYHDNPDFITALAESIQADFDKNGKPQQLLLSYHGMPERNLDLGDPYYCFCMKTTRLLAERLGLQEDEYTTSFQSRFGKAEWLKPYTDATLAGMPTKGIKDVAVVCPAFSADCLETLEEIAGENREVFEEAGGESYRYIPALNDNPAHIDMMFNIVKPHL